MEATRPTGVSARAAALKSVSGATAPDLRKRKRGALQDISNSSKLTARSTGAKKARRDQADDDDDGV
ncbi:hypothetical protein PINS_up013640 [Pythium insidiosum]|nr:hypothetical protein PINS_up013640 [Pythium insidiosum]